MKKFSLFAVVLFSLSFAACNKNKCKTCTVTQTITQNGQQQTGQTLTQEMCGDDLEELEQNNYRQTVTTPDGMGGNITTDQRFDCQ